MMAIRLSVVIPTRGRTDLLGRCLAAVLDQDFDPREYEVVIVDDGPDAATCELVEKRAVQTGVALRYVPVAGGSHGPAAARNAGWRAARGEIVAFTDDDCVPARSWLRAGFDVFNVPRTSDFGHIEGAWGQVIVPVPERPTDYERDAAGLEHAEFATANCFYRRSSIEEVGGFDERFKVAWREDSDLFFTLLGRHSPLVYAPGAIVVHPPREAPWGVSLKQQRKSMFNALLYRKHPGLYRERIQRTPPLNYYAMMLALVAIGVSLATRSSLLAIAAFGAWIALYGAFCARRLRGTSRDPRHIAEMIFTSALIPPIAIYWRIRGAIRFRVLFL